MNIFGVIAFIAAFKRYKNAKKAYEAARAKSFAEQDALLAAIDSYEWDNKKGGSALSYYDREPELSTLLEDLKIIPKLYFGYGSLRGESFYNIKVEYDLFNTSDKTITIMRQVDNKHDFVAAFNICGHDDVLGTGDLNFNITIPPRTGLIVTAPLGVFVEDEKSSLIEDKFANLIKKIVRKSSNGAVPFSDGLNDLYKAFQEANNKLKGISLKIRETPIIGPGMDLNIPKGLILANALFADIAFYYHDSENKNIRRALYYKVPGICEWAGYKPEFKDKDVKDWRIASMFRLNGSNELN